MTNDKTLLQILRRIVWDETRWLRHYLAKVVNITDPDGKGQVRVICYDLGYTTEDNGLWCSARNKNALITPKVGDWVEIYFMGGDRDRPVFIGQANDMEDMLPKSYDGKETTQVLFEDGDCNIKYDGVQVLLTFFKGTKSFVLGEDLNTFLTSLVNNLNSHTHLSTAPGSPTSPASSSIPPITWTTPSGLLSTKMKGE